MPMYVYTMLQTVFGHIKQAVSLFHFSHCGGSAQSHENLRTCLPMETIEQSLP